MALTTAQQAALKADILADPALAALAQGAGLDYQAVANALNAASNPAFIVWRTSVAVDEYRDALTWTEVDNLTAGKARIWDWVTGGMTLPLIPTKDAVRAGLAECWTNGTTSRTSLLAIAKRTATRAEGVLATGTGSDATPGKLTFEGSIQASDLNAIMAA